MRRLITLAVITLILCGAGWLIANSSPAKCSNDNVSGYPEEFGNLPPTVATPFPLPPHLPPCKGNHYDEYGQFIVVDNQGKVNNPLVNERANTCYDPGQVCTSEAEWEAGWYLKREQYKQR